MSYREGRENTAIQSQSNINLFISCLSCYPVKYFLLGMGAPRETIRDAIKNGEKRQMSEIAKDFQPYLYDIWNLANKETEYLITIEYYLKPDGR